MNTQDYLLDPDVVFLNHGSFGACPAPVFDVYQRWQRELERQPVAFLGRRHDGLLAEARAALADYLNTQADNLIFVPNATTGINTVARSLKLEPGDEILATDHEYGALDLTWQFICERTGARYRRHPIPLPVTSPDALVESLWSAVTPRTRVIYISHMTSPTALIFPVAAICQRARASGIMTIVDGAHAPGQVPVDLTAIDADFYAGNAHKWLGAPKGAGFLYARPQCQRLVEPLVISWGWLPDGTYVSQNEWQGTRDIAAFLTVPAAIAYQRDHDWQSVRARCHDLARSARQRLADLTSLPPITPDSPLWFAQMFTASLPACDPVELKRRLYDDCRVEVPLITWNERPYIRVSIHAYNTPADVDALLAALQILLPHT